MSALRVLIAEDEYVSATVLEMLVMEEGHEVCGVVSQGGAVVEAVRQHHPDIVLMDVHLADETTGIAATRELLRMVPVPVIVVSATESPEEQEAIAQSGALGFIKKPIDPDEFRVTLRIAVYHNEVMRQLRDSELLHRSLFDNAAVGIYFCHKDGYYLATNQAYAHMLGYSGPGELLRTVRSIDEQVYVEPGRRAELIAQLSQGKELRDMESRIYGRDGDLIWVAEHLAPHFDADGNLAQYEGVVINISDRKKAEADRNLAYSLVRNTMDAILDFVVVTDLESNIIVANQAFEREVLLPAGTEAVLRLASDPDQIVARMAHALEDDPLGSGKTVRGTCRVVGCDLLLDTRVSRYRTSEGEVLGAVFVMRPVTEERADGTLLPDSAAATT